MDTYSSIISTDELGNIIDQPNVLLVDCRFQLADPNAGRFLYQKDHLPGAYFCDLNQDMSAKPTPTSSRHPLPEMKNFQSLLSGWGVTPETQVVVYDSDGGAMAAVRLWWMLKICGHSNVAVLDGGYPKWILEARPVNNQVPPERKRVQNQYKFNPNQYLATTQIEKIYRSPEWLLLDARSQSRFLGLEDTVDPISGHIPNAVNLPFADLLESPGKLIARDRLETILKQAMGKYEPDRIIVYCGSGVTSILLVLAMEYLGMNGARVYPGSWSEWIRDTRHEIAAGNHPS